MAALKSAWILWIVLLAAACSPTGIRKGVQDHVLYSSARPEIGIKISPDFKFVKSETSTRTGFDEDNIFFKTFVSREVYIFENKPENRMIVIAFKFIGKPGWAFKPGMFPIKTAFDKGRMDILGNSYQYCTYAITHSSDAYLVKGYGRMVGALSNNLLLIHYIEKQEDSWERPMLTERQKKALARFEKDCEKDLQILDVSTVPDKEHFQSPSALGDQESADISAFLETLIFPRTTYLTRH